MSEHPSLREGEQEMGRVETQEEAYGTVQVSCRFQTQLFKGRAWWQVARSL